MNRINRIKRPVVVLMTMLLLFPVSSCGDGRLTVSTMSEESSLSDGEKRSEDPGEGTTEKAVTVSDALTETEEKTAGCVVYVCGAVMEEGVYTLADGSRVCDAVDAAGGFSETAARKAVNLARILTDGEQVYIPTEEEAESGSYPESRMTEGSGRQEAADININTATAEELTGLTGIGPSRAADIVAYREKNGPFSKPEDLMKVSGIGEATFRKLKDQICVK